MADWLKSAYSDVFAYVDLSKDDETQIRDAFRSYTPFGQQERMVMLFKELCIAAGLIEKQPHAARRHQVARHRRPCAETRRSIIQPISQKPH